MLKLVQMRTMHLGSLRALGLQISKSATTSLGL